MSRPDLYKDCTIACERSVQCTVCGRTKTPIGRDGGMDNGRCTSDCRGYNQEPKPGHLWPGELADMDREEEKTDE